MHTIYIIPVRNTANTNFNDIWEMKHNEKQLIDIKYLSGIVPVFKYLSDKEINQINYLNPSDVYPRGEIIYKEGSHPTGVYCITSGIVKLYKTGIEGKEQIIRFAQKGDIIAYRSVLSSEMACTTAKVIQDAQISFIPADVFLEILQINNQVSLSFIRLACEQLGKSNAFIADIAQKNVRERLAEILLILKEDFGLDDNNVLQISLTREEIANIAGTATESAIRLLSEFKEDKIIALNGRKITLLDESRLRRTANMF